jgi:shikimate kinase
MPFMDTDQKITQTAKRTIPEIFSQDGEKEFRKLESHIVAQLSKSPPSVISCGAGAILDPVNRLTLSRTGLRIYLQAELSSLVERLATSTDRPLLPNDQLHPKLTAQLAERKCWYEESELHIATGSDSPEQICQKIISALPS